MKAITRLRTVVSEALPPLTPSDGSLAMSRVVRFSALCGFLLVVGLAYVRLYFGASLLDEAFHVVVPYRYALGARPFVDEVHLGQTGAGLMAYPFVAGYHAIAGTDGIMLFSRHLFFFFNFGISGAVFLSLRPLIHSTWVRTAVSLLPLVFIPQNASLNYDSLGNGFFTAGTFLGIAHVYKRRPAYAIFAGFAHGLAIFAYPPLAIAGAAFGGALYFLTERSRMSLLAFSAAVVLPCVAWFALLVHAGLGNAIDVLNAANALKWAGDSAQGVARIMKIARDAASGFPLAPIAMLFVLSAIRSHRRHPRSAFLLVALLPLLALPIRSDGLSTGAAAASHYVANVGLIGLPLLYMVRREALASRLLIGAWLPGLVAGSLISWSNYTGGSHQGEGFFTASITALVALALIGSTLARQTRANPALTTIILMLVPTFVVIGCQFSGRFQDSSPWSLHTRVKTGPYAGLFTTPEGNSLIDMLQDDLNQVSSSQCLVLSYYNFPAGFLLSPGRPHTYTAWLGDLPQFRNVQVGRLLTYYARHGLPELVLRVKRIPYYESIGVQRPRFSPGDPLDRLMTGPQYERVIERSAYEIYARQEGSCHPQS